MIEDAQNVVAQWMEIRKRMCRVGLSTCVAEIDRMKQRHGPETIRRALELVDENPQAKASLEILLCTVRTPPPMIGLATTDKPRPALHAVPKPPNLFPGFPSWDARPGMVHALHREPGDPVAVIATPALNKSRVHVYGEHAVLRIEAGQSPKGACVVFVETAAIRSDGAYDWPNKITSMLALSEMLEALGVVTGDLERCSFDHNGKRVGFVHRGARIDASVNAGKVAHEISVSPTDAFQIAALLLAQIRANVPIGALTDVVSLARQTIVRMSRAAQPSAEQTLAPSEGGNPAKHANDQFKPQHGRKR